MDNDATAEPAPKRQYTRRQPREDLAREPARQQMREGHTVVRGRGGEILSRSRINGADPYDFPAHLREPGWDYQWIPMSVYSDTQVVRQQNNQMVQNGWRPVMADRWPNSMPAGETGHIIIGGQGLYERPMAMSLEARAEDIEMAHRQMKDRDDALMGGKAQLRQTMRNGFSMDQKYRGAGGDLRISIDQAADAPRPSYQAADD